MLLPSCKASRGERHELRGLWPPGRSRELSTCLVSIRIFSVTFPQAPWHSLEIARESRLHRPLQIGKHRVVRKRGQIFSFFHFPPPSSSASVELSSTSALENLEIASICGHRKERTHWLPEKKLWAASPSCQKMFLRLKRVTGCLS